MQEEAQQEYDVPPAVSPYVVGFHPSSYPNSLPDGGSSYSRTPWKRHDGDNEARRISGTTEAFRRNATANKHRINGL
jgi:hypothetical protein